MKYRALVVEDDEPIAENVTELLDSLGHEYVWVRSQEDARKPIAEGGFQYVLLDLSIPVKTQYGHDLVEYGVNLVKEIHQSLAMRGVPIIVMTAHGKDGFDIVSQLFEHGVVDCINKPFPQTGRTLASVIHAVLERTYRKRERGTTKNLKPEKPFTGGDLTFFDDRIELCGVPVVASGKSSQIWMILDTLKQRLDAKRYKAFPGSALAANGAQNSAAGSIRDFRKRAAEKIGHELGLKLEDHDVIETSSAGYRLNPHIVVKGLRNGRSRPEANSRPTGGHDRVNTDPADLATDRREQILALIQAGKRLRVPGFAQELRCGQTAAKRELDALRAEGLIEFIGPSKTGYYALAEAAVS